MHSGGLQRSRLAHSITALFLLVAVLPLSVCAVIVFGKFKEQINQVQFEQFDATLRSYGHTVLGHLMSANQVMESLLGSQNATDQLVAAELRKLDWVASVAINPAPDTELPELSPSAAATVNSGRSVLAWRSRGDGSKIYLAHKSPSGALLYAQLNSNWLWGEAANFAGRAYLKVIDDHGRMLASAGEPPPQGAPRLLFTDPGSSRQSIHTDGWNGRTWELFLSGSFSAPPWHLVMMGRSPDLFGNREGLTYFHLFCLVALTILLTSWLSMVAIRRQLRPLRQLSRATRSVAQREFDAFDGLNWNNEFGELAESFQAMSAKLKLQFGVLDTLASVDRQLLDSPKLESILDTLLPPLADLLGCETVSLLLFAGPQRSILAFDYVRGQSKPTAPRRVEIGAAVLAALAGGRDVNQLSDDESALLRSLAPESLKPIIDVQAQPLGRGTDCAGLLCLSYSRQSEARGDSSVSVRDFADRLSLVLANLRQAEVLRHQAHFDALTGLENRERFSINTQAAVEDCMASGQHGYLLYVDLDQFKQVNDTAGHAAGDQLLKVIADRIRACATDGQHVARLGGDEFAVLSPRALGPDDAHRCAQRIIAQLELPVHIEGRRHLISASIGIAMLPNDGKSFEELLKAGDIAMYQAKAAGRGRAHAFHHDMQLRLSERVHLEKELAEALRRHEFILHYQPIVDEQTGSVAVEALVRWANPRSLEPIAPSTFIPLAEANGLIVKLGEWIVRRACQQYVAWRRRGVGLSYVSVNVSVRQLQEPNFCDEILAVLTEFDMQPQELQIEVTESVLAHEHEIRPVLERVAARGIRLSLDDFGTGYSSLSYLRSFPISMVKIDRSFVTGLPHDEVSCQLIASIIAMCSALGKSVTAEGVETDTQRAYLRSLRCTSIQGYLLGRPMDAADVPSFVARLRAAPGATESPAEPLAPRAAQND